MINGCALTKWSKTDKIIFGVNAGFKTIDIMQTREILSNDKYYERNPLLKNMTPDEATLTMIGTFGLVYLAADEIPKYRTHILLFSTIVSGVLIFNNFSIGVGF